MPRTRRLRSNSPISEFERTRTAKSDGRAFPGSDARCCGDTICLGLRRRQTRRVPAADRLRRVAAAPPDQPRVRSRTVCGRAPSPRLRRRERATGSCAAERSSPDSLGTRARNRSTLPDACTTEAVDALVRIADGHDVAGRRASASTSSTWPGWCPGAHRQGRSGSDERWKSRQPGASAAGAVRVPPGPSGRSTTGGHQLGVRLEGPG